MTQMQTGDVVNLRERVLEHSRRMADPIWYARLYVLARHVAFVSDTFTTDDVWAELQKNYEITDLPDKRLMGAVIHDISRQKLIKATGDWVPSRRKACHGRPIRVWAWNIKR